MTGAAGEVTHEQTVPADVQFSATETQRTARKAYHLFRRNPGHRSLHFKKLQAYPDWYSVRVRGGYRAVGRLVNGDTIVWFFIGSHAEYDRLLD